MDFRDVPNLSKFQEHARAHSTCPITMETYRRVREIIAAAPKQPAVFDPTNPATVELLKASCAAIEKSNRILWACAAATDHLRPPMWDYTPDYESAITYFLALNDLELMAVTKKHRIDWE